MGNKLVIVESPAKAKTIKKILGKDFVVKSSMGHIRDLPVKRIGVDVEDSFKPTYAIVKGRQKIVDELKKALKDCDSVYLAPDPDREGEAIAWHLGELLKLKAKKIPFYRVQYNEITASAVRKAFDNPGEIDMNRVNSQQARRILDRIVGYKVSPVLWRRIRRGLSAGRVQSVALRIVCEREDEIRKFVSEEYWILGAIVNKLVDPKDPFQIKLARIDGEKAEIKSSEQAEKAVKDLEDSSLKVSKIITKEVTRRPHAPYITSTLQQAGSSYCSFSPSRTMSVAQRLYEGIDIDGAPVGLITYMRTDSFSISKEAQENCRNLIAEKYGKEYVPEKPNFYKSKASAQEAHEAIRPTDVTRTPESMASKLDPAQLKIYKLIWNRFVSSQMTPAKIDQRTVEIDTVPKSESVSSSYLFRATASQIKFPGFMKVSGEEQEKKKDADEDVVEKLPELTEGESLERKEWLSERKETQPPARYSEASLIRTLESKGVGRPSTYAQIISTISQRKYVTLAKRTLEPTDLGMSVNTLLVSDLSQLFDVSFTATMEESLDHIEKGEVEWTKMLGDFYGQFTEWMKNAQGPTADPNTVKIVLDSLETVTDWAPEVMRGKRKYSDEKFVESIRKQLADAKKAVSEKQMQALLRIGNLYRGNAPAVETVLSSPALLELFKAPEMEPPKDTTLKKFELLDKVEMDESAQKFVDSLRSRTKMDRSLSEAQLRALNNIVVSHSKLIEGFDQVKDSLDIDTSEITEDNESAPLLDALGAVKEWKPPVTRGKRVFDDQVFFKSLCDHFAKKSFLSIKQRASLKKMVARYSEQVPGFAKLAEEFDIKQKKKKKA